MNLNPFINLLSMALTLYGWAVLIYIILFWLIRFNVVNRNNLFVLRVNDFLRRIVEPVLGKIRRYIPKPGGVDLSPIVLLLLIYFFNDVLYTYFYTYSFAH